MWSSFILFESQILARRWVESDFVREEDYCSPAQCGTAWNRTCLSFKNEEHVANIFSCSLLDVKNENKGGSNGIFRRGTDERVWNEIANVINDESSSRVADLQRDKEELADGRVARSAITISALHHKHAKRSDKNRNARYEHLTSLATEDFQSFRSSHLPLPLIQT